MDDKRVNLLGELNCLVLGEKAAMTVVMVSETKYEEPEDLVHAIV
jgi:hypothetical protein